MELDIQALGLPIRFKNCPIQVSIMGVLGKRWTLLILRDIAFLKIVRFNQILRSIPGLTPRVLVLRLHELEDEGLIRSIVVKKKPRVVEWALTEKGDDTVPILLSVMAFGAKWYSEEVFEDGQARTLDEIWLGRPADDGTEPDGSINTVP
jgi:DNA-binding HxlR family transcriptional regulator